MSLTKFLKSVFKQIGKAARTDSDGVSVRSQPHTDNLGALGNSGAGSSGEFCNFFGQPRNTGKFVVEFKMLAGDHSNGLGCGLAPLSMTVNKNYWLTEGGNGPGLVLWSKNYGVYHEGSQVVSINWGGIGNSYVMAVDLTGDSPQISWLLNNEDTVAGTY